MNRGEFFLAIIATQRNPIFIFFLLVQAILMPRLMAQEINLPILKEQVMTAETEADKVDLLNQIAFEFRNVQLDTLWYYANQALLLARDIGYAQGEIASLQNMAMHHIRTGQFNASMNLLVQSMTLGEERADSLALALGYKLMGNLNYFRRDYNQALENYQKASGLNRGLGDEVLEVDLLNNIGLVFSKIGNEGRSLEYLLQAKDGYERLGLYSKLAVSLGNIGLVYNGLNQTKRAKEFCENAMAIIREHNLLLQEVQILNLLGKIYKSQGQYKQSVDILEDALDLAISSGYNAILNDIYENLVEVTKAQNKWDKALSYSEKFQGIKDSLGDIQKEREILELREKYNLERKERENDLLKQQALLKDKELSKNRTIVIAAIIGMMLSMGMAYAFFRVLQIKNQTNKTLTQLNLEVNEKQKEIMAQSEELRQANEEIKAMNENLENIVAQRTAEIKAQNKKIIEYAAFNSHKFRGPLSRILGLVALYREDHIDDNELSYILDQIHVAGKELDDAIRAISKVLNLEK